MFKKIAKRACNKICNTSKKYTYFDKVLTDNYISEYTQAEIQTNTKPSLWRRDRFYNLISVLKSTEKIEGDIVEPGCYRGLSSLLMCNELKKSQKGFDGDSYHIFDSFEGLRSQYKGMFAASIDEVKKVLKAYPGVNYHPGWIPEIFQDLPEKKYRFVHIDVDTPVPTVASMEYFYPRLSKGGLIVCDDYASPVWNGLKDSVDEWLEKNEVKHVALSTCQLLIFKD